MDTLSTIDALQNGIIEKSTQEKKDSPSYHFDKLKMYFGEDYTVNSITISQPTIGTILEVGEDNFYHALSPFLYNSTTIRLFLWDNNIDWNTLRDIEVFALLMPSVAIIHKDILKRIFPLIDFQDFQLLGKKTDDKKTEFALYSKSQDILLSEQEYLEIAEYLRELLNFHPKVERAKGKTTKSWIIQEERMNLQTKKDNEVSSQLLTLVSACINHPGFKYKLDELKNVGIYQFMDSVKRLQKYEESTAALKGCYSGFVDASKINKELLNFMSDI